MSVDIRARISSGVARHIVGDFKAQAMIPANAVVRAGRGARLSLRRQINSTFGRHKAMGGKAFADTIPKIPQKLDDLGNGRFGVRVRTKAWFNHRRGRSFDLFWLFENAPQMIMSGFGRMIAVPLPSARLPLLGRGATRKLPWPRDLMARGWKTSIIPAGRGGVKNPIIMGGPPGTPSSRFKPLYVLLPNVVITKKLNLSVTAKKFGDRIPKYIDAEQAKFGRRVSNTRRFAA